MAESTVRLGPGEHLARLSRVAEGVRAQLAVYGGQGERRVGVARNWERSPIEHGDEVFSRTIVDRVERLGDPILTTNAQADARFSGQESIVAHNLRSGFFVPLH